MSTLLIYVLYRVGQKYLHFFACKRVDFSALLCIIKMTGNNGGKVANLDNFGIPASLLTRWNTTIWDQEESCEDESEEDEMDEMSEMSPYNPDQTADDEKIAGIFLSRELKCWIKSIAEPKNVTFRDKLNSLYHQKHCSCSKGR